MIFPWRHVVMVFSVLLIPSFYILLLEPIYIYIYPYSIDLFPLVCYVVDLGLIMSRRLSFSMVNRKNVWAVALEGLAKWVFFCYTYYMLIVRPEKEQHTKSSLIKIHSFFSSSSLVYNIVSDFMILYST